MVNTPFRYGPFARLEDHCFINRAGLREGQLLADAGRLKGGPGTIVHGRYDILETLGRMASMRGVFHTDDPQGNLLVGQNVGDGQNRPPRANSASASNPNPETTCEAIVIAPQPGDSDEMAAHANWLTARDA